MPSNLLHVVDAQQLGIIQIYLRLPRAFNVCGEFRHHAGFVSYVVAQAPDRYIIDT